MPGWVQFLGGAAAGLATHESGHLTLDFAFDAKPEIRGVDFQGIPFFAISPTAPLSDRERYLITSAGFWVQHGTSEWLLGRPREQPWAKGWLAFNVLTSAGYAGAAFFKAGPPERDTRGISAGLGVDERLVGGMILAPALLDAYRYHKPRAKWAKWASRSIKVGLVVLALK